MIRLLGPNTNPDFVDLSKLNGPRFLVTVDTEEEFDWDGPFTRTEHGITHVPAISRFQQLCDENGVQPAYLVDYPIATDPTAIALLGGFARDNRAAIGVQLHPWVNPPFLEDVNVHNSFASNLSPELEREKLSRLHAAIVNNFGVMPDIYRAGRYGAGAATAGILRDLGVCIDSSARARFDYSAQGGPNYAECPVNPFWLIPGTVLELPVTTVFGGALRTSGNMLFGRAFSSDAARSMMSRTGLLERIALTPEGIPLEKAIEGIDMKALSDSEHTVFSALQDKLKANAQAIASSDKIEVQRTAFSSLSNNIYSLAKGVKISYTVVYQQYCPMKKMYWLSSEAAIKNPYYGKMMLTCGKVTDTLK